MISSRFHPLWDVFDRDSRVTIGYVRARGLEETISAVAAITGYDRNRLDAELVEVARLETLPDRSPIIV